MLLWMHEYQSLSKVSCVCRLIYMYKWSYQRTCRDSECGEWCLAGCCYMWNFWLAMLMQWMGTLIFSAFWTFLRGSWSSSASFNKTSNFVCSLLKFMHIVIKEERLDWHLCQTAVLICSFLPNSFMLINPELPFEINITVFTLKLHSYIWKI